MNDPATVPAGFSITVPPSWFEIDVSPATRNASIAALVEQRVKDIPQLWEQRTLITRLLRTSARDAFRAGAAYAACMLEAVDGAGMTASVTVSFVDTRNHAGDAVASHDAEQIAAQLATKTASDPDDTWRTVETLDHPAGRCVRTSGVEDVELPDGSGWIRSVVMQTIIPVPDTEKVSMVTLSSPSLALAEEFLDLFDAVTGTFRFVTDEPADVSAGTDQHPTRRSTPR